MEPEQPIEFGDETPPLVEQAKAKGWDAAYFDFNKALRPGIELFNPGLIRRPDGLWLLVRWSEQVQGMLYGMNKVWACKLEDDRVTPFGGPFLSFPDSKSEEQFEDGRALRWNNQTWVACVNFVWFPGDGSWWTGAHQTVSVFRDDDLWTPIARKDPPVGKNRDCSGPTHGKHEKNWTYFLYENRLHLLYSSNPWTVFEFGATWADQKRYVGPDLSWSYGEIRGGTPPILVDDLYWTVFHSSMPWRGRYRRYYAGALAFEAKPPFKPVLLTQSPLLIGSQNDRWAQQKPLVVFPGGAVFENNKFFVVYGINDLACGWVDIPLDDLMKLATPIVDPSQSLIADLSANAVSPAQAEIQPVEMLSTAEPSPELTADELRKTKLRSAAAKARSILAEKRAAGTVRKRRKKRRAVMRAKKPASSEENLQPIMN